MGKNSKRLILALTIIIALSITAVANNVSALPAPTASVPEFTVLFTDRSYTIPANTSIDPSTGKTITNPAQYINNKTIQISIKNQNISGISFLQYEIRMKGHYMQEWTNISSIKTNRQLEYTVLNYAIHLNNASGNFTSYLDEISPGDTVDFQAQAQIWIKRASGPDLFHVRYDDILWKATDWSSTQSITIPENNSSSPTPTVPELSWLSILPLLVSVLFVAVMLRHRKTIQGSVKKLLRIVFYLQ